MVDVESAIFMPDLIPMVSSVFHKDTNETNRSGERISGTTAQSMAPVDINDDVAGSGEVATGGGVVNAVAEADGVTNGGGADGLGVASVATRRRRTTSSGKKETDATDNKDQTKSRRRRTARPPAAEPPAVDDATGYHGGAEKPESASAVEANVASALAEWTAAACTGGVDSAASTEARSLWRQSVHGIRARHRTPSRLRHDLLSQSAEIRRQIAARTMVPPPGDDALQSNPAADFFPSHAADYL
jgi:hypothetical protein